MKTFLFLISIVEASTHFLERNCDFELDGATRQCFLKEILVSTPHSPNQMAVDKATNTLYFSFDTGQGECAPVMLRIGAKKLTVLKGVKDAFSMAHDPMTHEMYFGGSHGIYKYNPIHKTLKRLRLKNLDIWWLFVKKNLFFITFPMLSACVYVNKTLKHVNALKSKIHQFVYDNNDNIFFINATSLYAVKNNSDEAILIRDNARFVGMAVDNRGQVYVSSEESIYVLSEVVPKVMRLVDIDGVLGMTFDKNNNLIYSDSHHIIRLIAVSNDTNYAK